MEKRKVFKISIIDNEISRTEFDRNTFYTSDSELTLVFKLIERDYSYEHGEILLYNENDKSFVTREITKTDNDFVYEIDSDIIPHYGKWKAQLQLINDGDVYTSKPFEFVIENDLSNLAPQPTLTDINNWATLKQSANELIDEMRDVIVDVERAESERASQENIRKQGELNRVNNEQGRKNSELTRENQENQRKQAESKRDNNEKQRRIAEFERVENENTRQQAESQRQSSFETNESERQTTFETNESERQSAEEQRKIDHANRSAELDSKAVKVVLKNELVNGGFTSKLAPWSSAIADFVITSDFVEVTPTGRFGGIFQQRLTNEYGDKVLYVYSMIKAKTPSVSLLSNSNPGTNSVFHSGSGEWERLSFIHKQPTNVARLRIEIRDETLSPIENFQVKYVDVIDLTTIFGTGNEPTKEEMDELVKLTGFIDDEYLLNNKEMMMWTISLIRRNKNAIIALGGTI